MTEAHEAELGDRLLDIASHDESPAVILLTVDTSASVTYLNLYGCSLRQGKDLEEAYEEAAEFVDWDPIQGALDFVVSDEFDFAVTPFYPDWPDDVESGDAEIRATVRETLAESGSAFEHVKKVLFHHVLDFDPDRIRDEPL
jgi:hypothetical protein